MKLRERDMAALTLPPNKSDALFLTMTFRVSH